MNSKNRNGVTPLRIAIVAQEEEIIHNLLKRGADPRIASSESGIRATPIVRLQAMLKLREDAEKASDGMRSINPALAQAMKFKWDSAKIKQIMSLLEDTALKLESSDKKQ